MQLHKAESQSHSSWSLKCFSWPCSSATYLTLFPAHLGLFHELTQLTYMAKHNQQLLMQESNERQIQCKERMNCTRTVAKEKRGAVTIFTFSKGE